MQLVQSSLHSFSEASKNSNDDIYFEAVQNNATRVVFDPAMSCQVTQPQYLPAFFASLFELLSSTTPSTSLMHAAVSWKSVQPLNP